MSVNPSSALPGRYPTDRSLTYEHSNKTQSATRTKTSRALSMLGSTIGTVCKTAAVAALAAPFVVLASTLVPSSVYSAAASAASAIGSKIPSNAVTSTLSGVSTYALKHLPSYRTAQTLSKVAIPFGGLAVWGAGSLCVRAIRGIDRANERDNDRYRRLAEISRRSREMSAEQQGKAHTAEETNSSSMKSIWDAAWDFAQKGRIGEVTGGGGEDAGLSSMGERKGDGMEKDEDDVKDEEDVREDQQIERVAMAPPFEESLVAHRLNETLESIISLVSADIKVKGEPAM